jgi:hypothetical protein
MGSSKKTYASLVHCKQTGLEVNVEQAENMFLFHEQHAAKNHKTLAIKLLKVC